ncbi:ABC transporter substrate-binding protein [Actinophytocola sp.]|uniref:ABC transporter substrate-binding protein n=1 Tax=Actinophytocola sp. TaxID=1872138 RepID=UPI00389AAF60
MMKRLVAAVTALVTAASLAACGSDAENSDTLTVGTLSDSKPNAYQENGVFTGFDNELLKAIAAKQGLKLQFVATDFSALLGQVANGKFDIGSSAISQTEERKKTVAFSDPYNYQSLGIEAAEGSPVKDEKTLGGNRIGVVQGTVSDTWVAEHAPTAQLVRFPNDAAALSGLKTKAVDGAVFDLATADTYAKENADSKLKVVYSVTTDLPHGYAFKKGNTALVDKINAGLKQVIEDGTWEKLHKRFEPNAPTPPEFAAKS